MTYLDSLVRRSQRQKRVLDRTISNRTGQAALAMLLLAGFAVTADGTYDQGRLWSMAVIGVWLLVSLNTMHTAHLLKILVEVRLAQLEEQYRG